MIVWLVLSFLGPLALGLALVWLAWPEARSSWASWLLATSLAGPLGIGVASCLFFLWLLILGPQAVGYALVEAVIAATLLGWSFLKRPRPTTEAKVSAPLAVSNLHLPLAVVMPMALVCTAGMVALVISLFSSPHGAYDAWAIWNTHARFISRGGEHWRDLFLSGSSAHPDYPLLVPAIVARSWLLIGSETTAVPALVAAIFTLATAGILTASLALARNIFQACLAVVFFLGASHLIYNAAGQMADVPLSTLFLAPLALMAVEKRYPQHGAGLAMLAGALAALATWTKNEGLLFLVVFSVVAAGAPLLWKRPVSFRERILPFVAGAAPILLLVVYFKVYLAPSNDLFAGQGELSLLARLTSPVRYWQIIRSYIVWFGTFGRGNLVILGLYALCAGLDLKTAVARSGLVAALIVALMLLGYFFIFVTTPHDLTWHLAAFERLVVQLWPSLLLAVLLLTATPIRLQAPSQLTNALRV